MLPWRMYFRVTNPSRLLIHEETVNHIGVIQTFSTLIFPYEDTVSGELTIIPMS